MKKLIVVVLLAAAAYGGYTKFGSTLFRSGAFDSQGSPIVLLFTMDGCGQACIDVAADLRNRTVAFEEINVSTDEGRKRSEAFGVRNVPFLAVGSRTVIGSDLPAIEAALAETKGMEALSPAMQSVMQNHFDEQGRPRVVLYGTETCPYCKRMRAHLEGRKVSYQFVDVSGIGDGRRDFDILRGRGYPLIFVGFRRIDGYDEARVDQAVKELL